MEASALRAPVRPARTRPAGLRLRLRSDDQLVALFRLGHEEAFGAIHDRYRARLLAYTRQMLSGSPADAEDALQDVFLRAYSALRADDRPVTLRAWLYRVAHNRSIDHLRRAAGAREVELEDDGAGLPRTVDGADPAAVAERREQLRRLVCDVGRLPEQQRSALLMREMEGLTYAELADALQVTVPAIKSLLVRARIGLVEAQEARDSACTDICAELLGAHDARRRPNAHARRHLRDCAGCQGYRTSLAGVARGLGSLSPSPGPWGLLLKVVGLGGVGSGGAAMGGTAAGGAAVATSGAASGAALVGGSVATAKLAAVVCAAALVGGGAVEAGRHAVHPKVAAAAERAVSRGVPHAPVSATPAAIPATVAAHRTDGAGARPARPAATTHATRAHRRAAPAIVAVAAAPVVVSAPVRDTVTEVETVGSGGMVAPDEPELDAPDPAAASVLPQDAPLTEVPAATSTPAPGADVVVAVTPVAPKGTAPADTGPHR